MELIEHHLARNHMKELQSRADTAARARRLIAARRWARRAERASRRAARARRHSQRLSARRERLLIAVSSGGRQFT